MSCGFQNLGRVVMLAVDGPWVHFDWDAEREAVLIGIRMSKNSAAVSLRLPVEHFALRSPREHRRLLLEAIQQDAARQLALLALEEPEAHG
jgi:hypothetical protein